MRKKKHFYTVICLIAGVILLTTAAAANYGNANGYPLFKSAIKKLLYVDNFSASVKFELIYDGETLQSQETLVKLDSDGTVLKYSKDVSNSGLSENQIVNESWIVKNDDDSESGARYSDISHSGDQWFIYPTYSEPWSNPAEDEFTRKAIRFAELIADTFVGDLKNNFVQTSNTDGKVSYQIVLSGNQLPEYVSAGLSMMFSAAKNQNGTYVFYHPDFDMETEEAAKIMDRAWEKLSEMGNRGVIYVSADGTIRYFADIDEYYGSDVYEPSVDRFGDIIHTLNTDPTPETAKCYFTVDEEGRLLSSIVEGIVSSYDRSGQKHTLGIRITANINDYGTTVIEYPEIPESDTVYDYTVNDPNTGYNVKITRNGVEVTEGSEKAVVDTEPAGDTEDTGSANE